MVRSPSGPLPGFGADLKLYQPNSAAVTLTKVHVLLQVVCRPTDEFDFMKLTYPDNRMCRRTSPARRRCSERPPGVV